MLLSRKQNRALPAFTWTESVALPIALSLMEAQPMAMFLALAALLVSGNRDAAPLNVGELTLLLLGLLWWAMALATLHARGRLRSSRLLAFLRLCGLLVAWGALALPLLHGGWKRDDAFVLLGELLFTFWLWRRSLARARLGFAYETLATTFKVCLGTLLALLLLALLVPRGPLLFPALEASLTVFFFCGLIALSLTRLGILRQVRSVNGRQADPTRTWLAALTLFCGLLLALVFLLEAMFSYTSLLWVMNLLQPIWNGLGTGIGWLVYAVGMVVLTPLFALVSWLARLFHGQQGQTRPLQPFTNPITRLGSGQHAGQLPPELLQVGRWVVLAGAVLVLGLLIRASLHRWFLPYHAEGLEETREMLDRRALRQQRRQQRQTKDGGSLPVETLQQAESARAYYRLLLHTVATTQPELAHRPEETPLEYERRLRTSAEELQHPLEPANPAGEAVLRELTEGYLEERYGKQVLTPARQSYLHRWMPGLLRVFQFHHHETALPAGTTRDERKQKRKHTMC